MSQLITHSTKLLAISIANDLVDFLVLNGRIDENQGQFIFDKLADSLMELPEDELIGYNQDFIFREDN